MSVDWSQGSIPCNPTPLDTCDTLIITIVLRSIIIEKDKEELLNKYIERDKRYKESVKKAVKKYLGNNPEKRLFYSSKNRAKLHNLEFNISLEDIVIPERCPYLDIEITNIYGNGRIASNASIDRIDNTQGYVKGNIEIISDLANRMKQDATKEQLISFAKNILRIYGE